MLPWGNIDTASHYRRSCPRDLRSEFVCRAVIGGDAQVGCVYTAKGFEYDWSGVILGPDLVWRSGKFVSRREFNKDPAFKSSEKVSDLRFDHLVRNVYKVLLTRGMIGTVIYSTDPETLEALKELASVR
ncbi:DNA/RNA helicase domain-containing protein [Rhodococcus sp. NPDC057297]|uniref:DNA/RNA helicase domain-containing protein n=1 Tax=Rhodococcus sp. NPDC057297 TaxID=3346090 RepID=UPI00363C4FE6